MLLALCKFLSLLCTSEGSCFSHVQTWSEAFKLFHSASLSWAHCTLAPGSLVSRNFGMVPEYLGISGIRLNDAMLHIYRGHGDRGVSVSPLWINPRRTCVGRITRDPDSTLELIRQFPCTRFVQSLLAAIPQACCYIVCNIRYCVSHEPTTLSSRRGGCCLARGATCQGARLAMTDLVLFIKALTEVMSFECCYSCHLRS